VAWCELRNDYRNFRLDRCLAVRATERRFSECADRSLSDFLRKVGATCGRNKNARMARALSCCISN
jgi:predicted DNA-binding transcriptional regulator YafY